MKSIWYKIAGVIIFLAGLIWILGNLQSNCTVYFLNIDHFNFGAVLFDGIIGSILIFILFFFPGKFILKIKEKGQNKLTNSSVILVLIGVVWIVLVALYEFGIAKPDMLGMGTFLFGILPAGILYGVSILLLIINWFVNRNK